jgi:hypothetical protein
VEIIDFVHHTMNLALNRFQGLVSIWSFECLQVVMMAEKNSKVDDLNENSECDFLD